MTSKDKPRAESPGDGPRPSPGPAPDSALGKRFAFAVILGLVVYAALAAWSDFEGVGAAMRSIPWWAPVAACALSFTNYVVRFPRWQRYLSLSGSSVRGFESFRVYIAGLALTVSPGKVGEALKSWLIRDIDGTPLTRTGPIVLAERVTDLAGFLVLIGLSSATGDHNWIAGLALGLAAALIGVLASKRLSGAVLGICARLPFVGPRVPGIEALLTSSQRLLAPGELPVATLLATLGWALECVACWILATSILPPGGTVPPELGLLPVTYAFAVSAVAGAVVFISPGGLGVTEGYLASLLGGGYRAAGMGTAAAGASAFSVTLVTRLCTLWFAMGIGLVALLAHRRRHRRRHPRPSGAPR